LKDYKEDEKSFLEKWVYFEEIHESSLKCLIDDRDSSTFA